jgi:uncharacterized membrane protein
MATQNDVQPSPTPPSALQRFGKAIRNRIIQGLLLIAPVAITFWIIKWLYELLRGMAIDPVARVVVFAALRNGDEEQALPGWFTDYAAPALAVVIVLVLLYLLGMFVHWRLHRIIDWVLMRVPGVTTIYSAVNKVFQTLKSQSSGPKFKRVVLVAFPHAGMRVPAFVTASCRDTTTGRTILCVYVPTTPIPTSGYMLLVPEEDVTEISWDINQTLQAIVSGGITVPDVVDYYRSAASASGE